MHVCFSTLSLQFSSLQTQPCKRGDLLLFKQLTAAPQPGSGVCCQPSPVMGTCWQTWGTEANPQPCWWGGGKAAGATSLLPGCCAGCVGSLSPLAVVSVSLQQGLCCSGPAPSPGENVSSPTNTCLIIGLRWLCTICSLPGLETPVLCPSI